jgi:hypothetical protein
MRKAKSLWKTVDAFICLCSKNCIVMQRKPHAYATEATYLCGGSYMPKQLYPHAEAIKGNILIAEKVINHLN